MNTEIMKILVSVKTPVLVTMLLLAAAGAGTMLAYSAKAEEVAIAAQAQGGADDESWKNRKFEYKLEDRPDPFYPFLSKELAQKAKDDEIVKVNGKQLSGMQLFEPGQLKLVAVMDTSEGTIAMAEDVTGKGYKLNKDMPIGAYGKIVDIKDGQVFIKETYETQSGRIIQKEITMRLKNDEDNKRK